MLVLDLKLILESIFHLHHEESVSGLQFSILILLLVLYESHRKKRLDVELGLVKHPDQIQLVCFLHILLITRFFITPCMINNCFV